MALLWTNIRNWTSKLDFSMSQLCALLFWLASQRSKCKRFYGLTKIKIKFNTCVFLVTLHLTSLANYWPELAKTKHLRPSLVQLPSRKRKRNKRKVCTYYASAQVDNFVLIYFIVFLGKKSEESDLPEVDQNTHKNLRNRAQKTK